MHSRSRGSTSARWSSSPWTTARDSARETTPARQRRCQKARAPLPEGHGVPCLTGWLGRIPTGRVIEGEFATAMDLLPTIARLASGGSPRTAPSTVRTSGFSLPATGPRGSSTSRSSTTVAACTPRATESGSCTSRTATARPRGEARDGDSPRPVRPAKVGLALFDLEADAGETANIAERYPEVVERLQKLIDSACENLGEGKRKGRNVRLAGRR